MAKVQNFSGISPDLPFTEFDFYELYRRTFETSELGKIRKRLPLGEMAENFGLISKSMRAKKGRKAYFTPEGKVALMFLKMYTGLSSPKLMEHLNGNIHYQLSRSTPDCQDKVRLLPICQSGLSKAEIL